MSTEEFTELITFRVTKEQYEVFQNIENIVGVDGSIYLRDILDRFSPDIGVEKPGSTFNTESYSLILYAKKIISNLKIINRKIKTISEEDKELELIFQRNNLLKEDLLSINSYLEKKAGFLIFPRQQLWIKIFSLLLNKIKIIAKMINSQLIIDEIYLLNPSDRKILDRTISYCEQMVKELAVELNIQKSR